MESASCPIMNPLLEVSDFDADSAKPMALCTLPSANEPVRFALPAVYLELVRGFNGERTTEAAIDDFLVRHPGAFARDWLHRLVSQSLLPKGILMHPDQDAGRVAVSEQPKRGFLYIKLPLVPPGVVDPIARRLGFLFHPIALVVGLVLFLASHALVYGALIRDQTLDFNQMTAGSIAVIMGLSTLGTFVHEFGHAAAAAHYGCRRMTIGWGLYLIYTVLWTNVSEAWRLPRRQRAVIDIGGVHLEAMFLLGLLGLYLWTANTIFLFGFLVIDLSIAMTLNPFLRMDGYWLMSDLFGIVNLRKQQTLWMNSLVARWSGGTAPPPSGLSVRARRVLGIYTVLGAVFLGYLLKVVYEIVVVNIVVAYPTIVAGFWAKVQGGHALAIAGGFLELAWRTLIIVGAALMVWRVIRGALHLIASVRSSRAVAVPERA